MKFVLLNGNGLGQISGFIHIQTFGNGLWASAIKKLLVNPPYDLGLFFIVSRV